VLLGAWGLFLIFDPTGQAPDTFRRWLDGWGRFSVSAASTVLAAALLGAVTWTSTRRSVLADLQVKEKQPRALVWAVVVGALCVGARLLGSLNLFGAANVTACLFVLEHVARSGWAPRCHPTLKDDFFESETVEHPRLHRPHLPRRGQPLPACREGRHVARTEELLAPPRSRTTSPRAS
jgi:hypothetical protein